MNSRSAALLAAALGIIVLIVIALWPSQEAAPELPTATTPTTADEEAAPQPFIDVAPESTWRVFKASAITGAAPAYQFSAIIPPAWQVEAITSLEAINLYNPDAPDISTLEQSQIFIRFFTANQFLTLSTVDILEQHDLTINDRPARRYDIVKQKSVPPFKGQPSWRNEQHLVTDVRVSDASPAVFYVIAKRPDLDDDIYQQFLDQFVVDGSTIETSFLAPIKEFKSRLTKKPFGLFVSPENSPVQPERFSGWHTGVDIEYQDISAQVVVKAFAAGTVAFASRADGYGGVVVLTHPKTARGQLTSLYGHLDPASLPPVGQHVEAGEKIGLLGQGNSAATDGERKHLHFAIAKGNEIKLKGYVDQQAELTDWYDPLSFF